MAVSHLNALNAQRIDVSLGDQDLHVWTLKVGQEKHPWDHILSRGEIDVASRLSREHGLRYKNVRAILRLVLARYLLDAPHSLQFRFGPHGKPYIPDCGISFNISHSNDTLVIAVARNVEVGIDIEVVRKVADLQAVAMHFFEPSEIRLLENIDPALIDRAFLQFWTRKEAILKAAGLGLANGLPLNLPIRDRFDGDLVSFGGQTDEFVYLYDLQGGEEFVGAVATRGQGACIVRKSIEQHA